MTGDEWFDAYAAGDFLPVEPSGTAVVLAAGASLAACPLWCRVDHMAEPVDEFRVCRSSAAVITGLDGGVAVELARLVDVVDGNIGPAVVAVDGEHLAAPAALMLAAALMNAVDTLEGRPA